LCARPCLHIAAGRCVHGGRCEFCHLPHDGRQSKMDKRQREMLQTMPGERALELIHPMLHQKLLGMGATEDDARAVADLCRMSGRPVEGPMSKSRSERALVKVMGSMTVRHLLIVLQRTALRDDAEAQAAVEALAQRLLWSTASPAWSV